MEETVEFRKVSMPDEIPALCDFDKKTFQDTPGDFYSPERWVDCECYWVVANGQIVGCTAFELNTDGRNSHPGYIFVSSTGVLPEFRGRGFGNVQKEWQIRFALERGFTKMFATMRKSNARMISINEKFGFTVRGTIPGYYGGPDEDGVAMELDLSRLPLPVQMKN